MDLQQRLSGAEEEVAKECQVMGLLPFRLSADSQTLGESV
jgi:hypothetical protein